MNYLFNFLDFHTVTDESTLNSINHLLKIVDGVIDVKMNQSKLSWYFFANE